MKDYSWLYFFTPFVLCLAVVLLVVIGYGMLHLFRFTSKCIKRKLQRWLFDEKYINRDDLNKCCEQFFISHILKQHVNLDPKFVKKWKQLELRQSKIEKFIREYQSQNKNSEKSKSADVKRLKVHNNERKRYLIMLDSEERELIKEAYQNGDSVKDISSDLDIEESVIYQYLFESGLL